MILSAEYWCTVRCLVSTWPWSMWAEVIIRVGAGCSVKSGDESHCQLNAGVYSRLWRLCGGFEVDRFATGGSVQKDVASGKPLPYWSLHADGAAQGVDALTADWRGVRTCLPG